MFAKLILGLYALFIIGFGAACAAAPSTPLAATPVESPAAPVVSIGAFSFPVYTGQGASGSAYVPSGWMGDTGGITLDDGWTEEPYQGETCIHLTFTPQSGGEGWGGIYWLPAQLDPARDWGSQVTGRDLSGASRLTFWARGAKGGEQIEFFSGGIEGEKGDSLPKKILTVTLEPEWREYSINLNGADMSRVVGAFGWAASKPVEFWLDEVKFE